MPISRYNNHSWLRQNLLKTLFGSDKIKLSGTSDSESDGVDGRRTTDGRRMPAYTKLTQNNEPTFR